MTVNEILEAVKKRTGRSDLTSISTELLSVLTDITARHAFLKESTTQTWTDGTRSYAFPTGATRILYITCQSGSGDKEPLRKISFAKYLEKAQSDNDKGQPYEWAEWNKHIYPFYIPNGSYTATIYYRYVHPSDLSDILLGDEFKECIIAGVCFIVMGGQLGIADESSTHYTIYENQLSMLAAKIREDEDDTVEGYY